MNQQNKADCIPGRYFPCLADHFLVTFQCHTSAKLKMTGFYVFCDLALALEHMGPRVHFIVDDEGNTLYICPHKAGRDSQAPLWGANYQDDKVAYWLQGDSPLMDGEPKSNELISTIESIAGIPAEERTGQYKIRGYYSYELEALVFPLERNKIDIMPNYDSDIEEE